MRPVDTLRVSLIRHRFVLSCYGVSETKVPESPVAIHERSTNLGLYHKGGVVRAVHVIQPSRP